MNYILGTCFFISLVSGKNHMSVDTVQLKHFKILSFPWLLNQEKNLRFPDNFFRIFISHFENPRE